MRSKKKRDPVSKTGTGKASSKPKGETEIIAFMEGDWARVPNGLIEDQSGQLWLTYIEAGDEKTIDTKRLKAVGVIEALAWLQHVSGFCDCWTGDVADICRIAIGELKRRGK